MVKGLFVPLDKLGKPTLLCLTEAHIIFFYSTHSINSVLNLLLFHIVYLFKISDQVSGLPAEVCVSEVTNLVSTKDDNSLESQPKYVQSSDNTGKFLCPYLNPYPANTESD